MRRGAAAIMAYLDKGMDVAFPTLGDPTVYSTYIYVHKRVQAAGYETEIVSGITSFCAVAARLNTGLVEKAEPLHVIPASYQIEEALKLSGTKVLMKAGKKMAEVKKILLEQQIPASMIENCGMENERIYRSPGGDSGRRGILFFDYRKGEVMITFCRRRGRSPGSDYPAGKKFLEEADVIIYAGSLVNPQLLDTLR